MIYHMGMGRDRSRSPPRRYGNRRAYPRVKREDSYDNYRRRPRVKREYDTDEWGRTIRPKIESASPQPEEPELPEKEQPTFKLSGLLAKASNKVSGAPLKYSEPSDASMPDPENPWSLYIYDGETQLDRIPLSDRSWYLLGRDERVCHIFLDDISCSKQHAVIQFRKRTSRDKYGDTINTIKPYIIDLESSNGTILNPEGESKKLPEARYLELLPGDTLVFGGMKVHYMLLNDALD